MNLLFIPLIVSLFCLAFVVFLVLWLKKQPVVLAKPDSFNFKKQFKVITLAGFLLLLVLYFTNSWKMAAGFLLGAVLAAIAVWVGINVLAKASAPEVEFKGGLVLGLLMVSLALLGISAYYFLLKDVQGLLGFVLGTGLVSVFLGNGARAAADIFETYTISIIAPMLLGLMLFPKSLQFVLLPLILASVSILTSIIASFFNRVSKNIGAAILFSAAGFLPVIFGLMQGLAVSWLNLYFCCLTGFVIVFLVFVAEKVKIKQAIVLQVLLLVLGTVLCFWLAGPYGFSLAVMALLSISGIVVAVPKGDPKTKGYAIVSAVLAGIALFLVFSQIVNVTGVCNFALNNPRVIAGVLIGGMLPYLLISIKETIWPALILFLAPIIVGFGLGAEALGGLLIGAIVAGLFLEISTKETANPAINSAIKLLPVVSLILVNFLI